MERNPALFVAVIKRQVIYSKSTNNSLLRLIYTIRYFFVIFYCGGKKINQLTETN